MIVLALILIPIVNIVFLSILSLIEFLYLTSFIIYLINKYREKNPVFRNMLYLSPGSLSKITDKLNYYIEIKMEVLLENDLNLTLTD